MYGYEMIDTLRGKSKNVFELKAGTLYPLLHGLEEKGFVESYEKEAVGKIRKYYHITRSGKKELKKKYACRFVVRVLWDKFSSDCKFKDFGFGKLYGGLEVSFVGFYFDNE